MKRFTSLEFGDSSSHEKDAGSGEPIRDEHFFYSRAVDSWLAGDFELALRNYSRALERHSSFFDAWIGQIEMLIELGEYPEALVWSDKALEIFPEHPDIFAAKAIANFRDEKTQKAIAFSDNSVSKENTSPRVWLARAEVLMRKKNRIAETCLSKAVAISGNSAKLVKFQAGRILSRNGKYSAALEYLEASIRALPKSPLAWYELGCCQSRLGFKEAKVSFEQSLHLRPQWEKAEAALRDTKDRGMIRRLLGKFFGR